MTKEVQPKCHEFWLKKFPDSANGDPNERLDIYRVALGKLIEARERQTYQPKDGSHSPDFWNKSGSFGFMDITVRDESVPKEGALTYPNPDQNPYLEYQYPWDECEIRKALVILTIGIEPDHRRNGFARLLKQKAEEIASAWDIDTIVANMIENPIMRELNTKLGYIPYDRGMNAVKRLQTIIRRD